ncbi:MULTISPECIES: RdgB/HAM1 family non-canonical purine NTP pyrophosphatase [unclassified Acinetobacter]|uniref:RdgB/HAM1 family non-canonical purine NTP pyrophosphatase n=1 Tax=unclassified Acinetobacter TaxID=196816 RepID=UPI0035B7BAE8
MSNHQKIVLASNNKGKLAEFEYLFQQLSESEQHLQLEIIPQGQLNIDDAVEDGLSFVENAIIKARHASRLSGLPAIADDSGLVVPILDNAPGIYSARYAGEHGNDAANNQKLLQELLPFRAENPQITGLFVCVLAMVRHADDPLPILCHGIWHGEILAEAKGEQGFGYDPLFWLPELGKSSAEMAKAEKNQISHRGMAMQQLKQHLLELSGKYWQVY